MNEEYMADNAGLQENAENAAEEVSGESAAALNDENENIVQREEQVIDEGFEEPGNSPDGADNTDAPRRKRGSRSEFSRSENALTDAPQKETGEKADNANKDSDTITKTQAFSRRLNDLSGRKVDEFISGLGWVNPYTNNPIRNQEQYKEFLAMQNAAQAGKDPVTESRINGLEAQVRAYKELEEDTALQNDPVYGQYYKKYRDDVIGVLNLAKRQGMNIGIKDVFNTVIMKKLPDIMAQQKTATAAETVKSVSSKAKASPGGLGGETYEQKLSVADMNDKQFDDLYRRVMRGERVVLK